jgi:hypothetical protein
MPYFSILKEEAIQTSKISTNLYRTTWRHIPERSTLLSHRCMNLKSDKICVLQYKLTFWINGSYDVTLTSVRSPSDVQTRSTDFQEIWYERYMWNTLCKSTVTNTKVAIFLDLTPSNLVQAMLAVYLLFNPEHIGSKSLRKTLITYTGLQGLTSHTTVLFVLTSVRISNNKHGDAAELWVNIWQILWRPCTEYGLGAVEV